MKINKRNITVLILLACSGCVGNAPAPELSLEHPANPKAEESEVPKISNIQKLPSMDDNKRKGSMAEPKMQHKMMPGMKM